MPRVVVLFEPERLPIDRLLVLRNSVAKLFELRVLLRPAIASRAENFILDE
jgi:hypothetical protein